MNDGIGQDKLISHLADLDEKGVLSLVNERLEAGHDPYGIIEACQEGVRRVGTRYEKGDYFIAGLIMAGVILRGVIDLIRPDLQKKPQGSQRGNFVLGTVQGDIHNIGKDLVGILLSCEGFNVIDVGVDTPVELFVDAIREHNPPFLGLSCLLTTAFESLRDTISGIEEAGLRSGLTIIIGGSTLDESVCKFTGADHWTTDAMKGVEWCRSRISDD